MPRFKALRVHKTETGSETRLESLELSDLNAGQVLIRVAYSSVNYKDALAVTGRGPIVRGFPRVPGIDLSGHVESSEDPRYPPGAAVLVTGCSLGESIDGGYAEFARVPADAVVPLPSGLSLFEAMAIGTAGFTAAFALRRMLENHQAPEAGPIAITGATGGVGSVAVGLFKRAGFKVAAITGKKSWAEAHLKALGADEILARQSLEMGQRPLEKALWGGAVDNVGGETLAWLTRTVKPWGNIASIGLAQGAELHTSVMPFILRGISLIGIHSVECPMPWRLALWKQLSQDWKPRSLEGLIARRSVPLEEVPAVCDELMAGTVQGRTVVRIGGG